MSSSDFQYAPLVTILIPVYNGGKYVGEAIESALEQTYPNIEILVINDGSEDNTEEVVLSYGDRIRYIRKENGGVSSVLNMGIDSMRGEWLSWLSHDDKYLPDKILRQVRELNDRIKKYPEEDITKTVLYCANERIDADGRQISRKGHKYRENEKPEETMLNNIKSYNICGCAVLVSKKAFADVGYFKVDIPTVSDTEMWYRMMFKGYRFVFMNKTLVQSRQHKDQVSHRVSDRCLKEQNDLHIWIAKNMLPLLQTKSEVLRLRCYLTQRGFEAAADVAGREYNLRYGDKSAGLNNIRIRYYKFKHRARNALRKVYRKVTLK